MEDRLSGSSPARAALIRTLEERFRRLSLILYDTSVEPARADAEVAPMLDENVRFTDPWQQASGRAKYRLGAVGFHAMFRFALEIAQVSVQLSEDGASGRAIVDGVMNLRPLGPLFTYPLRTILVYDFALSGGQASNPGVLIRAHEEMWSVADMLAALPVAGWLYRRVFRPGFSRGFLAASWLSARARGLMPDLRP
jgi:hypothetical protein